MKKDSVFDRIRLNIKPDNKEWVDGWIEQMDRFKSIAMNKDGQPINSDDAEMMVKLIVGDLNMFLENENYDSIIKAYRNIVLNKKP